MVLSLCLVAVLAAALAQARHSGPHVAPWKLEGRRRADSDCDSVEQTLQTPITYFDPLVTETFAQRYWVNDKHKSNATYPPIFLEIGGEGEMYGPPCNGDEISNLASTYGGIAITLEHRFYGKSMPRPDLSVESLAYLTSELALADVAHFVDFFDAQLNPSEHVAGVPRNKWVLIGGSYSGALAGWMRVRYPHISVGNVGSSDVVDARRNFVEFDQHQSKQLSDRVDPSCAAKLRAATDAMERAVDRGYSSRVALFRRFGADRNYNTGDFFYLIADTSVMALQYGHVNDICDPLLAAGDDDESLISAYESYVKGGYRDHFGDDPASLYDRRVMRDINPESSLMMRQWWWQTCIEFGWFQPAPEEDSLRSDYVTIKYHEDMCRYLFGLNYPRNDERVDTNYGGPNPDIYDVYFTAYVQDPWQEVSYRGESSDRIRYSEVDCFDCGHCADMGVVTNASQPELQDVVQSISDWVGGLLERE